MSETRKRSSSPSPRRAIKLGLAIVVCIAALAAGCTPTNEPKGVKTDEPVEAEAVQATLTAEPGPVGAWPEKVGSFAASYDGTAWYPTSVPEGFSPGNIDVVELEPKTGLVCDMVFVKGDDYIVFTQGSSKARSYDVVSVGKTAWGDAQADLVHEDPSDTSSPQMIVFADGESVAELSGSVDVETLRSMAESMMRVE